MYRTPAGNGRALVAAGLLGLLVSLVFLFVILPNEPTGSTPAAMVLFSTLGVGSATLIWMGLHYRRHWVRVDASGLSRPWAGTNRNIRWDDIQGVAPAGAGRFRVLGSCGSLEVTLHLTGVTELIDLILDQLDTRGTDGDGGHTAPEQRIRLPEECVHSAGALRTEEIRGVHLVINEQLELATEFVLTSGQRVTIPNREGHNPLEEYRQLRSRFGSRSQRPENGEELLDPETRFVSSRRRALLAIACAGVMGGAAVGIAHGCQDAHGAPVHAEQAHGRSQ